MEDADWNDFETLSTFLECWCFDQYRSWLHAWQQASCIFIVMLPGVINIQTQWHTLSVSKLSRCFSSTTFGKLVEYTSFFIICYFIIMYTKTSSVKHASYARVLNLYENEIDHLTCLVWEFFWKDQDFELNTTVEHWSNILTREMIQILQSLSKIMNNEKLSCHAKIPCGCWHETWYHFLLA